VSRVIVAEACRSICCTTLPYYPFWSLAVIALDVVVIWALCNQRAKGRPA
jgi:hypothetical protein